MKAIFEYANGISQFNEEPSLEEVLSMIVRTRKVDDNRIDDNTIAAINTVLVILEHLKKYEIKSPPEILARISEVLGSCENVSQVIGSLRAFHIDEAIAKIPNMEAVLLNTISILAAGEDSIYNPGFIDRLEFTGLKDETKITLKKTLKHQLVEYAKVDGKGAKDSLQTVEIVFTIGLEPTSILTIVATATVCGAIHASGAKLVRSIWRKLRGK